jgi:hypothetical protein
LCPVEGAGAGAKAGSHLTQKNTFLHRSCYVLDWWMDEKRDSQPLGKRQIDAAAKAEYARKLRSGIGCDEAAAALGFTAEGFGYRRRRDDLFNHACKWAIELSAADQREAYRAKSLAAAAQDDPIRPNNLRPHQRRRKRGTEFTEERKQCFLDHFAGTADVQAACDAAGVHYSTVYKHRSRDPVFAQGWEEALAHGYALLDAEALRQRLAAQKRARFELVPTGELTTEFDRLMKLLERRDKLAARVAAPGQPGPPGTRTRWTFEESIHLLDKRLRALGVRRGIVPPGEEEEGDEA